MSSSVSGSRVSSRLRLSSGETIEKNGFSVVAATSVTDARFDGAEQRVLLGLGEAVDLVDEEHGLAPGVAEVAAGLLDHRPHLLDPGVSADSWAKRRLLALATSRASVVLPVPGGP